jgi:pilus assembly protein CpaE
VQADALAPMLDLTPVHTISDLTDPSTSIDSIRLESAICKHPSGLYLLGAPARIEDGEMVSPGTIEATVGVMLQLFDFVLIDCGHHVSETSVAAWERAGNLFYVLDQSITGVHATRRFLELFKRLNLKHVALDLLLNNYRHSHAITLEKIESALEHPIGFCIPHDSAVAAGEAHLDRPTSSPMPQALESLANALLGISAEADGRARTGVLSRMLAAFGLEES